MTDEKPHDRSFDRYLQLIAGIAMWAWLMYQDSLSKEDLFDYSLSSGQFWFAVMKYTVAFVLIKGISISEIALLLKAWRGK